MCPSISKFPAPESLKPLLKAHYPLPSLAQSPYHQECVQHSVKTIISLCHPRLPPVEHPYSRGAHRQIPTAEGHIDKYYYSMQDIYCKALQYLWLLVQYLISSPFMLQKMGVFGNSVWAIKVVSNASIPA